MPGAGEADLRPPPPGAQPICVHLRHLRIIPPTRRPAISPNVVTAAYDFETITVSSSAIGLTSAKLEGGGRPASRAVLTVETNNIRYRTDGTDPSATVGHLVVAGATFVVEGAHDLRRLKLIRQSADASVSVTFERE